MGEIDGDGYEAYCNSKLALAQWTYELADHLKGTNVRANLCKLHYYYITLIQIIKLKKMRKKWEKHKNN